jgi:hypothetical protein
MENKIESYGTGAMYKPAQSYTVRAGGKQTPWESRKDKREHKTEEEKVQ